jgi:hypothetical protein
MPMNSRGPISFSTTGNSSAESGTLMYDDAENKNPKPEPTFRPLGSVSNSYQHDSRFATPLESPLHDNAFPLRVVRNIGRDASYPDTAKPLLSGTELEVSGSVTPSNGRPPKRPGRCGRLQCESCRRQKKGIEVAGVACTTLTLVCSTSYRTTKMHILCGTRTPLRSPYVGSSEGKETAATEQLSVNSTLECCAAS